MDRTGTALPAWGPDFAAIPAGGRHLHHPPAPRTRPGGPDMIKTKPVPAELNRLRDFGLRVLARRGALAEEEDRAVRAALAEMQSAPAGHELITEGQPLNRPCLLLEG